MREKEKQQIKLPLNKNFKYSVSSSKVTIFDYQYITLQWYKYGTKQLFYFIKQDIF
jgi:hypothetical protein